MLLCCEGGDDDVRRVVNMYAVANAPARALERGLGAVPRLGEGGALGSGRHVDVFSGLSTRRAVHAGPGRLD